jgi:hypothetical protein
MQLVLLVIVLGTRSKHDEDASSFTLAKPTR